MKKEKIKEERYLIKRFEELMNQWKKVEKLGRGINNI